MPPTTRSKRKRQQAELERELLRCAMLGVFERLRELVELERVSVNCSDDINWTPLMHAAFRGSAPIARFLLENGANVDAIEDFGRTALSIAVRWGNVALSELLLQYGANGEIEVLRNYTALAWAVSECDLGMVRLLLRFGVNTEETLYRHQKCSALYIACRYMKEDQRDNENADRDESDSGMEIVQLLLDHDDGVEVNDFCPRNGDYPAMSPLCAACLRKNLEIAQVLIQNGAQMIFDGIYPDVPCPLKQAVECGSLEILRFLLEKSPFSETEGNRKSDCDLGQLLSLLLRTALERRKLQAAQMLIDHGADINGGPYLWQCAKTCNNKSARFLLRSGANVNQTNNHSGETPLWAAAERGNAVLVRELLNAGADVELRNSDGETPFGVAYRKGHKRTLYLLLRTSPHAWSRLRGVY